MKELEVALMSDAVAFGFRQFLNSLYVLCVARTQLLFF